MLNADEHLHLGLHAISVRNHHEALKHLHSALELRPDDARATYLLAVQHAELGLTQRGIQGLRAALALDPSIEMARFQLGLMLLDASCVSEAKEHLKMLAHSGNVALQLFSTGVIDLVDGRATLAQGKILEGLAQPSLNSALAAAMRQLLGGLEPEAQVAEELVKPDPLVPMALGAYVAQ